jgi:hypothetical protein
MSDNRRTNDDGGRFRTHWRPQRVIQGLWSQGSSRFSFHPTDREVVVNAAPLLAALLFPTTGLCATLSVTIESSTASVDLASVGTLDWARWPGYVHKADLISDVTTTGQYSTYSNDIRWIGTRDGIRVTGYGASFELTVAATTQERTLRYYAGGWNSNSRLTVTLPGAPKYTTNVSGSGGTYSGVAVIKFKADANTSLKLRFEQTSTTGHIRMQAAALQGASSPPPAPPPPAPPPPPPPSTTGSAILTWTPPRTNTNGTSLTDLRAFKVYWGTEPGSYPLSERIDDASARSHTISGLSSGRWYFVVTAVNSAERESAPSAATSKMIQ